MGTQAQEIKVMDWETFQSEILHSTTNKTKVINFWATWCRPCIAELPAFEEVQKESSDSVEVVLVSLDNVADLEKKVLPFVQKKQLQSKVVLLNDVDFNAWLPKIDSNWGGEIPATLVIDGEKSSFHSSQMTKEELILLINKTKSK